MALPLIVPTAPMLAKAATALPHGDYAYEPKWDGFRVIVVKDGDAMELRSRGGKPLTRYFPELEQELRVALPKQIVLDGEIVVRSGLPGQERLDWDALSARIHPASSRIAALSQQTPASIIAFDLLGRGERDLTTEPYRERRGELERLFADIPEIPSLHLTRMTLEIEEAQRWFEEFEGAGLDGVVAKSLAGKYEPGKRAVVKIKHHRTAEAVLLGYRIHKSGEGVGSLLLGLFDDDGELRNVGGMSAFTAARRKELVDELDPWVVRENDGQAARGETERSRFSSSKDVSFVRLRPERVVEVAFDQLEGRRFRHSVRFLRWRPDREPSSCTLEQVDRAPAYDLAEVLGER